MFKINYRIDPADSNGIHLVDTENGGERVYILFSEIKQLKKDLEKYEKKGGNNV